MFIIITTLLGIGHSKFKVLQEGINYWLPGRFTTPPIFLDQSLNLGAQSPEIASSESWPHQDTRISLYNKKFTDT